MEFADATSALTARLAAGNDDLAAAGAIHLAVEAWKRLSGGDAAWDRFGLELLDVRSRLYSDDDVVVDATVPATDGPHLRHAVMDLVEQLAQHHDRRAVHPDNGLAQRLDHDAAAQQLRRAVAALA
ncbi:hypothetical protein V6U90_33135 [Micromonospora sp. CPCC 206060]|uniref:hypothetical protein n=1 Tax=Micromonospora sp. CPCC 206060 TaxID=3122406 RepID=UPI002FF20834